jgi:hypothetical protein
MPQAKNSRRNRYTARKEKTWTRDTYKILQRYLNRYARELEKNVKSLETKQDWIKDLSDDLGDDLGDYILENDPAIMVFAGNQKRSKYKKALSGWKISFDNPVNEEVQWLTQTTTITKAQLSATTETELRRILAQGVADGQSGAEIAKGIRAIDPGVFSRSRANLIAVQEVNRSYGFADNLGDLELQDRGFVVENKWLTSGDGNVRATHEQNASEGYIPLGEDFSGTGDEYGPSQIDFRCRCITVSRIVGVTKNGVPHILK